MSNQNTKWQKKVLELADRTWDREGIRDRLDHLRQHGFGMTDLDWTAMQNHRVEVLNRVQRRAEEYEYFTHSCAKGSALALMEAFNLGNWDIIRAMSPFPGFGMTGGTMTAARAFIDRFKEELGTISCPELQEDVIFGRYMDPRGSKENFTAFQRAKGYEKCAHPPGVGARLAADIMLDSPGPAHLL